MTLRDTTFGVLKLRWHIGDVVRKLREGRFGSQEALGIHAGHFGGGKQAIDKGTINRLEKHGESRSSPETIDRVARALGIQVSDLYALVPVTREPQATDSEIRERDEVWAIWRQIPPESRPANRQALERAAALAAVPDAVVLRRRPERRAATPPKVKRTHRKKPA